MTIEYGTSTSGIEKKCRASASQDDFSIVSIAVSLTQCVPEDSFVSQGDDKRISRLPEIVSRSQLFLKCLLL